MQLSKGLIHLLEGFASPRSSFCDAKLLMCKNFCRIYYIYVDGPLEPSYYQQLLQCMPEPVRLKAVAFKRWEDAHALLFGRYLLSKALSDSGSHSTIFDISYRVNGRPQIEGFMDFNISHSGNLVVCAVSSGHIGIDVELHQNIAYDDFVNSFSEKEWQIICSADFPLQQFFDHWTAKEAVLKADGRGLVDNLSLVDVSNRESCLLDGQVWHLRKISYFRNYSCSLAGDFLPLNYILKDMSGHFYPSLR